MEERKVSVASIPDSPITDKVWLYEENIKKLYSLDDNPDRKPFLDEFFCYRRKNGLYSKIPVIARKPLDVFVLYFIVQKYGGFEQTMKNRMWSQIARELDLPRTMTSGAFTLKLKYIRLLYQFECFKCQKPINHSILYNESTMADHKELAVERKVEGGRYHRSLSRSSESTDERKERDYRTIQGIEYRKSLTHVRSSSNEEAEYCYVRHHETSRHYDSPSERVSPLSSDEIFISAESPNSRYPETSETPREVSGYPYYLDRQRPLKRKYADDYFTYDDERVGERPYHHRRPTSNVKELKQFSVDLLDVSDNHIVIKVWLNNEKYEGVLKPC